MRAVTCADELDEIDEAVRVAPLVVVPAEHLHHAARSPSCRATRRCTTTGSARCRPTRAARRCTRARRGSSRRSTAVAERVVDRVDVDVVAAAIATRSVIEPVGVGHPQRHAVELALELGQHEPIACAAPVEFGMIDSAAARMRRRSGLPERVAAAWSCELLVARVRVHGVDEALLDAERVVQHLRHRREAVGGARRVRDDGVRLRVVDAVVHAHADHHVGVAATARR